MDIVFILLPASLLLVGIAIAGYIWATRSGQYEDLETPALRILNDDEFKKSDGDQSNKETHS